MITALGVAGLELLEELDELLLELLPLLLPLHPPSNSSPMPRAETPSHAATPRNIAINEHPCGSSATMNDWLGQVFFPKSGSVQKVQSSRLTAGWLAGSASTVSPRQFYGMRESIKAFSTTKIGYPHPTGACSRTKSAYPGKQLPGQWPSCAEASPFSAYARCAPAFFVRRTG